MYDNSFDIIEIEQNTMNGLKDFQRETVNRIDYLFRNGQSRVLVADEVGLGKTLIARGAIVKTAKLRLEQGDDLFKVVYICSNQNIANQNIRKLKVSSTTNVEGVSETRLSMQHLKITEQENNEDIRKGYIQLIPLTPDTSFRMTNGGGNVEERALMFAILKRSGLFSKYSKAMEDLLVFGADKAWDWAKWKYIDRVNKCEEITNGEYPANVILKLTDSLLENGLQEIVMNHLAAIRYEKEKEYTDSFIINKLRVMFAEISVSMLQPDLVIMDEFQRFKFLLSSDENSDTGILAKKFMHSKDIHILLLSATPYKLYATIDEVNEVQADEPMSEFFDVMEFLFDDEKKQVQFKEIWSNYSVKLHEMKEGDTAILQVKNQAEDAMYQGVCRTERISVMNSGDYLDDSSVKKHMAICENDIRSYLEAGQLLNEINADFSLPIDYIKSCPYILSFMRNYKVKESIEKYFKKNPDEVNLAKKNLLWVNTTKVDRYEELPKVNSRFEKLLEHSFYNKSELYLWVPPSRPYYEMQGVYKDSIGFSKILVFSAWEMVPRMIGALVSYESERRTVGKLSGQAQNDDKKNAHYYVKSSVRFPVSRLRFNISENEPRGMSLFNLLYPSKYLAELYNPIHYMNERMSLREIEKDIKLKLEASLITLKKYQGTSNRFDDKWYYLCPMLLDGLEYVDEWIESLTDSLIKMNEDGEDRGNKGLKLHIERLEELLCSGDLVLGKMPDDLVQTLINMVIASPAVCAYRMNGCYAGRATELAKIFINRFNTTEATAIVDLAYGRCKDDNSHWKNVLKYCKDGSFQSMLDEYYHLILDSIGFAEKHDKNELIHNIMLDSLKMHSASYTIDTFNDFKSRVNGNKSKSMTLRSQFAVGFVKGEGDDSKKVNRKESIRNAFNSPMRPFVLATTSIGQEGLDFHNYCRKIMHWNLPSNPVDLEQREGRINRYKCLAIRQNIAQNYGNILFAKDIWNEMFTKAIGSEKKENSSDLIPFWCLGENQKVKIERIVPMYPMSKDVINYERLIKILSMYRLTLGQARQEELLKYIFNNFDDSENLKELFIDLSPFSKEKSIKNNVNIEFS